MLTLNNDNNDIKTVSLFSGAGGLDIGAIKAGARVVFANDIMKEAAMSYRANIGDHIVLGDLNTLYDQIAEIDNVDLVIGGPPCQGFSVAGKMDISDPRSKLVWSYAKVVELTRPRAFIMENVKALGKLEKWAHIREKLLQTFRSFGYAVDLIVLNASDFDVPQARERVFVVGFRDYPNSVSPDLEAMIAPYRHKSKTVREVLSVLDKAGTGNNMGTCKAKITLAANPIMRKSPYAGMIFNGLGRPVRIDGYCSTLPASMGGNKTPIIDEKALYDKESPWVESYHKEISEDITKAKFTPAPEFLRRLTVEEAGLIQTFPIEYEFQGAQSSKYTQIGNAVPCNLGNAVARMVIDVLHGVKPIIFQKLAQLELQFEEWK